MPFTNFGKKTIEREFDTSRFQHKIEVVHFAADVPIIRRKKHDRYINIIFVGTANQSDPVIFNMKGGREAISAFRIISKKYPNVRMKIISNIPQGIDTKIERLETQMHYLRNQYAKEKLNISDDMAEELIVDFIKESKARGVVEIDVLDIADSLKLPFDQIRKIMDNLS